MRIPVSRARRRLALALVASLLTLLLPATGSARPTMAELRVEAGGRALAPGDSFISNTAGVRADRTCGGSGRRVIVPGATALGILGYGELFDGDLRPLGVSDQFDFGVFVCRIGAFRGGGTSAFWLYKVNHRSPEVGADQRTLVRGDKVLWYFQDTLRGQNVGDELELSTPPRVRPGQSFTVAAFAYDAGGVRRPAAGAQISGGGAITDAQGRAVVTAGGSGLLALRAARGGDIPSAREHVCVNSDLSRCPPLRGERIYGTGRRDSIVATAGADFVLAGGEGDYVDVRGGGVDLVWCGAGRDRVRAGTFDRVARTCETVLRPR